MNVEQIIQEWARGNVDEIKPEQRRLLALVAGGADTERDCTAAGEEFALAVKESTLLPRRSSISNARIKADDSGVVTWVLSDEIPDRAGDIIRQDGWKLENFKRNPVLLWGHAGGVDSDADEPIGRTENLRVEKIKGVPSLVADLRFAVNESERAQRKFRLAQAGFISAGSVGFRPEKTVRVEDEDERAKLGLGRFGVIFEKQELLEFSLVAIPANPNALQQSFDKGLISRDDMDELLTYGQQTERDIEKWARSRSKSFVDMGKDEGRQQNHHSKIDNELPALATVMEGVVEVLRANLEVNRELAQSLRMLARSNVDLGGCIGAASQRANTERPKAEGDAVTDDNAELRTDEVLRRLNRMKRKD